MDRIPVGAGGISGSSKKVATAQLPAAAVTASRATSPIPGVQSAVNVKDYGAIGDGVHTAADTAAFVAAVADLSAGGVLFLPPAFYTLNQAITLSKPISVIATGFGVAGVNRGCQVVQTVDGTDAFVIASDYVAIERLTVTSNVNTPTGGVGIHQVSGAFVYLDKVGVSGFFDNVRFELGQGAAITRCAVVGHQRYGIWMQNTASADTGDSELIGNYIGGTVSSAAGLRYESSGGLRTIGNKIILNQRGIDLQVPDGAATGVFPIVGNSIENQSLNCIRIGRSGTTGTWKWITLGNNQINGTQLSGAADVVQLGAGISEVAITGNIIEGTASTTGVHVASGANGVAINGNNFGSHSVGIQRDGSNVSFKGNQYRNVTTPVAGSGSLAQMDSMADEGVQAPTLAGTFSNFGAPYRGAGFYRTAGLVKVTGVVKNTGADTTVFTLPAGYRPSASLFFRASASAAGSTDITVASSGTVTIGAVAPVSYLALDGIEFLAEA